MNNGNHMQKKNNGLCVKSYDAYVNLVDSHPLADRVLNRPARGTEKKAYMNGMHHITRTVSIR